MKMKWAMPGLVAVIGVALIGGNLILSKNGSSQSLVAVPGDWKRVELDHFSFSVPPDLKRESTTAVDSSVWVFSSDHIRLVIDFGPYSNNLEVYHTQPGFSEELVEIAGKKAKIASFRLDDRFANNAHRGLRFVAAAYFASSVSDSQKLTFWVNCNGSSEQQIAKTIFHSIRFK